MTSYSLLYRLGITPWDKYLDAARTSIARLLDREEAERSRPLGRALDLGCGHGRYTSWLAERGWEAVGVDNVPAAVETARHANDVGARFEVADVTDLARTELGAFDFLLDVGCMQGLRADQRVAMGRSVARVANPGATMLVLAFQPTRLRWVVEGVAQADIEAALGDWELVEVQAAETVGLGWPQNRTSPQWYRLRHR